MGNLRPLCVCVSFRFSTVFSYIHTYKRKARGNSQQQMRPSQQRQQSHLVYKNIQRDMKSAENKRQDDTEKTN
jgi:hypothetical protein